MAPVSLRLLWKPKAVVLLIGVATLLAFISTAQAAANLSYGGEAIPWVGLLKARLVNWYGYALFVPLLYALALARPITRSDWLSSLPLHVAASLACALGKEALFVIFGNWFRPGVFHLPEILAGDYFDEVLLFWAVIAIIHLHLSWQRARPDPTKADRPPDRFLVSGANGYRFIPAREVEWIEAQGNYAQLNTSEGHYLVRLTMSSLERRLASDFLRVHRSAMVNRSRIVRMEPRSHGAYAIILASGAVVEASRSYNKELRALLR